MSRGYSRWSRLRWWWDTRVSVSLFELGLYVLFACVVLFLFFQVLRALAEGPPAP